jgi:hypothetical protein
MCGHRNVGLAVSSTFWWQQGQDFLCVSPDGSQIALRGQEMPCQCLGLLQGSGLAPQLLFQQPDLRHLCRQFRLNRLELLPLTL